jgi:preprotein translocase subunit SecD
MQSRSKWWITTIVLLFLLSFLYAFQPIRLVPKASFDVQSTFRYTFPKPLADTEEQLLAKSKEIQEYLTGKAIELDHVKFIEQNVLEIETLALDSKQAEADRAKVLQALIAKYPGATAMALPDEQQKEKPIAQVGTLFAIYRPTPKLRLGLDLLGGAHVVLRCLPETRLTFSSPDDRPMAINPSASKPAGAPGQTAEGKPIVPTNVTYDLLAAGVQDVLVKGGAKADDIEVKVPSDNMLLVRTRAQSQDEVDKQQKIIAGYLERKYAGVTITPAAPESVFLEKDTADKVLSIIDRRLYAMSDIREPVIQVQGKDRLIVELPGIKDPERVVQILKSTAMLEFRLIPQRYSAPGAEQDDYSEWHDAQSGQTVPWERVLVESQAEFTGRDLLSNSRVETDSTNGWVVHFELKPERKAKFREFTRRNIGRLMAIVLDDKAQMAPVIKSEIPGAGVIEGHFTAEQARDLKLLLNAGALPVPLEVAENRTISATLGTYAIQRSLMAGIVGFIIVVLFMVVLYRLPGLLADVALCLYVLIVLAVLTFTKTTLTLPGIAGIILSIGMAVDANILIFERLKEEVWSGKSMRAAIDAGFERAWTAILDANMNTMIVAAVLYFLGTSSIKSFAVTLFVGVLCSLFTAVTLSRWMVTMLGNSKFGQATHLFGVKEQDA